MRVLLCLCCITMSLFSFAQKFSYEYNAVKFKCKVKSGTVCITEFDRDAPLVIIPSEVTYDGKTYRVTTIDTYRSGDNYNTTSLTIEDGILEIANYSFIEFRNLAEVNLPNSIIKIGKKTFAQTENISFNASPKILSFIYGKKYNPQKQSANSAMQPSVADNHSKNDGNGNTNTASKHDYSKNNPKKVNQQPISDIDKDIPYTGKKNENSFAVIIANETYDVETSVEFALNDGELFKKYCNNIFGIPDENIRFLPNATHMQIKRTMAWLEKVTKHYANNSKVYFYYAGHGMPDEKNGNAYILPTDGYAADIAISGYKLSDLYQQLGDLPAKSVTVFLDACFSGMKRDGEAVLAARSVAIAPEEEEINGNVVVFSATSDAETAYSYKAVGHGLFSYYLMKKLKETKGMVSYGELSRYIETEVGRKSLTINDKSQTPTVQASPQLEDTWKTFFF